MKSDAPEIGQDVLVIKKVQPERKKSSWSGTCVT